jgi:ornithine cyclodeaminase/alanine dehydrogenase-like protein (mu-crystallin family)
MGLLYLSDADVDACALSAKAVNDAVEAGFRAKAEGRAIFRPQIVVELGEARLLLAKAAAIPPYAAVKWLGVYPGNRERAGVADFHPLVLLSRSETGQPLALMDGRWITGQRTAAISAVAAKYLARPEAATLGVVACGLQARTHLAAFAAAFPLKEVRCWSRTRASAERFAEDARQGGFDVTIASEPRGAVEGCDLVASLVGDVPDIAPFLDARWLAPGSFVALVDMGRPWYATSFEALDKVTTDDPGQNSAGDAEQVAYQRPFHAEIAEMAASRAPGRESATERNGVCFNGIGIADVAVAAALYERAVARKIGTMLPD